jgi:hypothetical protein
MEQFIPQVTQEDVERVLQRDFPAEHWQELREMIQRVQVRGKDRVMLACMKAAGGDVHKLKGNLNEAEGYWREIISEAEYPFYTKKMFRIDKLTEREKSDIIEKDKKQYLDWLNRTSGRCR